MIFAGLYFQGEEAETWLRKGVAILERELSEQVLEDGGHFERSPMYHLIVLEDCVDLINIFNAFAIDRPASLNAAATAMMQWAAVMQHPDGGIPFFNDATFGIAPEPAAIVDYGARLGIPLAKARPQPVEALCSSGYVRLSDQQAAVFFDAGPVGPDYLPGHAHADTLSVEASFGGQRVLVNSGTSVYGRGAEREWQRSTAAHNTCTVDGMDSSEVWSGFRVARRARVHDLDVSMERGGARAWHDGFTRLRGRPRHSRDVWLRDSVLAVEDRVTGRGRHTVVGRWYLHPSVEVVSVARSADKRVLVRLRLEVGFLMLTITGADFVRVLDANFYPCFGVSEPSRSLVYEYHGELPARLSTRAELEY
ncbi:hypothetical protein SAOR_10505 [Salinisphaera orenii MK-B5]|uniref:Uncharacterized protein n=1 Tax=Salinisphaera orenii MK-B5 TaxID=856730 RepID=A0A423PLC4_9GAMM|nr:hypothetical protein SAOR_10505 [Salinisphaera orenii MK-B5]